MPKEFWKTANPHHMALEPEGHKNRHSDLSLTLQFIPKRAVSGLIEDSRSPLPTLFYKNWYSGPIWCVLLYPQILSQGIWKCQPLRTSLLSPFWSWTESGLLFSYDDFLLTVTFFFQFSNVIYNSTFISCSPKGNWIFWVLSDVILPHLFMWYTGIPPFSLCCFSGMEVPSLCSTVY